MGKVLLNWEDVACLGSHLRRNRSTFLVKKTTGPYPALTVDGTGSSVVPHAGARLLLSTAETVGLTAALSAALAPWRRPLARHDPGKIITDLAVSLAIGGDCLADLAQLRASPEVFGPVASDPTVSRLVDALAADAPAALAAINTARAAARGRAWSLAGQHAPDRQASAASPLVIDVDATLVGAHSEKECAAPTFKRGFGFHPLWAFCDHGAEGTGEPLAFLLRPGNAGSNTATDHITVLRQALAQLPGGHTRGQKVLVRVDGPAPPTSFWPGGPAAGWPTRSGSPCPAIWPASRPSWPPSPMLCGSRPTTPTASSAPAPGSPRSPACSTCVPGRRVCG